MTFRRRARLPRPAAVIFAAGAFAVSIHTAMANDTGAYTGNGNQVKVSGNRLFQDGKPWVPHGVVQIAFVKAPGVPVGGDVKPFFAVAADDYTPDEYAEMRYEGADSVRMQIGQPGLVKGSGYFSETFRQNVLSAIKAARAAGLVVIVSMQDEHQTGAKTPGVLPDRYTIEAWRRITPTFAGDNGVIFELYNEPELPVSSENWPKWQAAMEAVVRAIRPTNPDNVLIADGLEFAESLAGAPLLHDKSDQIAYAVHPYAHSEDDQKERRWATTFGTFAARAPVIVTEWNIGYFCNDKTPAATKAFLQYIDQHGIGLEAATWDWQPADFGSVAYGFPSLKPTSYTNSNGTMVCHEEKDSGDVPGRHPVIPTGFGPGTMVETWYRTGTPPIDVE